MKQKKWNENQNNKSLHMHFEAMSLILLNKTTKEESKIIADTYYFSCRFGKWTVILWFVIVDVFVEEI